MRSNNSVGCQVKKSTFKKVKTVKCIALGREENNCHDMHFKEKTDSINVLPVRNESVCMTQMKDNLICGRKM